MNKLPEITEDENIGENLDEETEMVVIQEDLSEPLDYDAPLDRIFMDKPTNGKKVTVSNNKRRIKVDKVDIPLGLPPGFSGHKKEDFIPMELTHGVKKPKAKKPITEKQKAHLDKIRKLALEKRRSNAREKKGLGKEVKEVKEILPKEEEKVQEEEPILEKVEEVIDYKKEKELLQNQKYLERLEARRRKIELRIIKEEEEEEARFKQEERDRVENEYFNKFVKNMDKYNYIKKTQQAQEVEKKVNKKIPDILETNDNPFKNIFEW